MTTFRLSAMFRLRFAGPRTHRSQCGHNGSELRAVAVLVLCTAIGSALLGFPRRCHGAWREEAIGSNSTNWQGEFITSGNPRNPPTYQSVIVAFDDRAMEFYRHSSNPESWSSMQVTTLSFAQPVCVGDAHGDGNEHLYVVKSMDRVYEYTYNSGSWSGVLLKELPDLIVTWSQHGKNLVAGHDGCDTGLFLGVHGNPGRVVKLRPGWPTWASYDLPTVLANDGRPVAIALGDVSGSASHVYAIAEGGGIYSYWADACIWWNNQRIGTGATKGICVGEVGDASASVYVGKADGVYRYYRSGGSWQSQRIWTGSGIIDMEIDDRTTPGNHLLFVVTDNGLYKVYRESGQWKGYRVLGNWYSQISIPSSGWYIFGVRGSTGYRMWQENTSAPQNVDATDSSCDKVRVTWSSVSGATHYLVYRHTSNNSSNATPLGQWQQQLTFDDTSAVPGQVYYYWVRAGVDGGHEPSGFSQLDAGRRAQCCDNSDCNWPCEQCKGGSCVPRTTCGDGSCNCGETATSCCEDCAPCCYDSDCDDGQFCNGAEWCDANGNCQPGSDPCPGCDGDNDCSESCNEAQDNCTANDPNGCVCNDGLFCTQTDTCNNGTCSGTGDPCPGCDGDDDCSESCNEAQDNCTANDPNGCNCNDGLFCNGTDTCSNGSCSNHSGDPCPGCDGDNDCSESCRESQDDCNGNDPNGCVCNDGLFCTQTDTCNNGTCIGTGDPCPGCDGDNDCSESCNEAQNNCTANDPNGCGCDDGAYCTVNDACQNGACAGPERDCRDGVDCTDDWCDDINDQCVNDPNDDRCRDDLFCNGDEWCDLVLDCQPGTNPCLPGECCDEETDTCGPGVPCNSGPECDDGEFCNGTETCVQGCCQSGTPPNCNDSVDCTDDSCDEINDRCVNDPNDDYCRDDLFCNGDEWCDLVLDCQPGANPCLPDECCDEETDTCGPGVPCAANPECDDGEFCNGTETCLQGCCQAGTPVNCDDGADCTDDSCDELTDTCMHDPNDLSCGDGLSCNGVETCDPTSPDAGPDGCVAGDDLCPNQCCDEQSGCYDGTACVSDADCDDGLWCTGLETCVGGCCEVGDEPCAPNLSCIEATQVCECDDDGDCTDTNPCTENRCSPGDPNANAIGCLFDPTSLNGAACDDGNPCTSGDVCSNGNCAGTQIPGCPCTPNCGSRECGDDGCGGSCGTCSDDGLFCTGDPVCTNGTCGFSGSPCQGNTPVCCEESDGCVAECCLDTDCPDDGLFCTKEACENGTCVSQGGPCEDDEVCCEESDSCNVECCDDGDCGDGNACTADGCDDGVCVNSAIDCDDDDACTTDTCDAAVGCVNTPIDCDDGDLCTEDGCVNGACENMAKECNDGQFCNGEETCDPDTGQCLEGEEPCDPDTEVCNDVSDECKPDSDRDGVQDDEDECPGTPPGEAVDDGDGCRYFRVIVTVGDEATTGAPTREGEEVIIDAPTPPAGQVFSHWEGSDVPDGQEEADPLRLVLDSNKNLTAVFQQVDGGSISSGAMCGACGNGAGLGLIMAVFGWLCLRFIGPGRRMRSEDRVTRQGAGPADPLDQSAI